MDDITPDMDWAKFLRFKSLCDRYQVKPLIGVVPSNMDENLHIDAPQDAPVQDFWGYVRQLGEDGWCIAQHGVTHIYTTKKMGCFPLNRLSEFAGTGFAGQYASLQKGQGILKANGIETDMFMAPAHSFDRDTIKALRQLGFCRMTDGFGQFPYVRWGMTFYPISYRQDSVLENIEKTGYSTFVVHTNTMNDKDFKRYEQLFADYRNSLVSYSELLAVKPQKRGVFGNIKEYLMAVGKFVLVGLKGFRLKKY